MFNPRFNLKMNAKGTTKKYVKMADPYKVWKEKPPGLEQKELERMFDCKEIDASSSPDSVRKSNELFQQYSSTVFASHFRKTKAKYGLHALNAEGGSFQAHIQFENAPFCTWTYTDHNRKCDFVCVALPLVSGSRNINFVISQDGMKLTVNYTWPSAMYNAEELFGDKIKDNRQYMEHPKVHAFISHLLNRGITKKSNPQGSIIIDLPRKVKREIGSWKEKTVHVNDTKIILLEFISINPYYRRYGQLD